MFSFCKEGNPWTKYKQLAKEGSPENLSGIWFHVTWIDSVIKQHSIEASAVRSSSEDITHKSSNLNLLAAYADQQVVYPAYERMDLSLEQLHSCIKYKAGRIPYSVICQI
jgi:hypothetical protein